jgi:hypothetical protein
MNVGLKDTIGMANSIEKMDQLSNGMMEINIGIFMVNDIEKMVRL